MRFDLKIVDQLNNRLICKSIEELHFEEVFCVSKGPNSLVSLNLANNVQYLFEAQQGIWGSLHIKCESLKKFVNNLEQTSLRFHDFIREAQSVCEIDDDTLAKYIEEANQTLHADYVHYELISKYSKADVLKLNFAELDQILSGHPKLLLNKGRLGWGTESHKLYAPESLSHFQLHWIAVSKKSTLSGIDPSIDYTQHIAQTLNRDEIESINKQIKSKWDDFFVIPVHPWQWQQYIQIQFLNDLASGDIIDLGLMGPKYTPQSSIRTLSNVEAPTSHDVKLAISILNTSCVRGIPQKYIPTGHTISKFLEKITQEDSELSQVRVLKEIAAFALPHKAFKNIELSSYRYKEFLGCVWRESVASKLSSTEKAVPVAALLLKNEQNKASYSYLAALIDSSGLSAKTWMQHYFRQVVLPLYHLQLKHGVGLVAHGQNTILVLENSTPKGLIVKDFHGDLRLAKDSIHINHEVSKCLDQLPAEHLIHDLITAHLLSVLRYMSRILSEDQIMSEKDFYQTLSQELLPYIEKNKPSTQLSLLRPKIEKILVNKVRFAMGYTETPQRLKPMLGSEIDNPLNFVLRDIL